MYSVSTVKNKKYLKQFLCVFHLKAPVNMVSKCMKNEMCHMTCFCIDITPQESEPWRNVLICPVRKLDCIKRFSVL